VLLADLVIFFPVVFLIFKQMKMEGNQMVMKIWI